MKPITIENLKTLFAAAAKNEWGYVYVVVEMKGFRKPEYIINDLANAEAKAAYYEETYTHELRHKHAAGIKIIAFGYVRELRELHI